MRDNGSSYQAARRHQAEHTGVSDTRAKRITAARAVPMKVVFHPGVLRSGSDKLMSLASQLRSDPGSRDIVVAEVVAQLRELASRGAGKAHEAIATVADDFKTGSAVTAESIEEFAQRLKHLVAAGPW